MYVKGHMEEVWGEDVDRALLGFVAGRGGDCRA